MRLMDYLRLGFAGVKAHKARALTVVIIVGLLFGVITAGALALQGLENAVLEEMLEPTGGKVLVASNVDQQICGEDCNREAEMARIRDKIQQYGGKVVDVEIELEEREVIYKLEGEVIRPFETKIWDLSFANLEQDGNPLNLILAQVRVGTSFGGTSADGVIFAEFPDLEMADDYYRDAENHCEEIDRVFGTCDQAYKYQVMAVLDDPLTTYENLQNVWLVFVIVAAVLAAIALIIALSTYARLISKDTKIIALYHAMGATGWQIRIVYMAYLLILSVMVVGFALTLGVGLATILSLVNGASLEQVSMLAFGVERKVWLLGWSNLIWGLVGAVILVAPLAVLLGNGNFRVRELAKKMK